MYVQVNIGRNYNTSNRESLDQPPLTFSDAKWSEFVNTIRTAIDFAARGTYSPTIEVHYGKGSWSGGVEESAHVSSFNPDGFDLEALRFMIEDARFTYSQDAIALIVGSELIEA